MKYTNYIRTNLFFALLILISIGSFTPTSAQSLGGILKNRVKKPINDVKVIKKEPANGEDRAPMGGEKKKPVFSNSSNEISQEKMREYSRILFNCSTFLEDIRDDYGKKLGSQEQKTEYSISTTKSITESMRADGLYHSSKHYLKEINRHLNKDGMLEGIYYRLDKANNLFDKATALKEVQEITFSITFIEKNITPGNSVLIQAQSYCQKLLKKMNDARSNTLRSSGLNSFMMDNVNKILFTSNVNIDPATANDGDFKSNFKAGENIVAVIYFDAPYQKIFGNYETNLYRLSEPSHDNVRLEVDWMDGIDFNKPYAKFYIALDGNLYKKKSKISYPAIANSLEFLSRLSPRAHSIEVKLDKTEGAFKFDGSNDAGLSNWAKSAKQIREKFISGKSLSKAGMKNRNIENELVRMFNNMGWSEKFTKAVILSSDYGYKRSNTGVVTGRTLQVQMVSKKADGTCQTQKFSVIQPKTASGYGRFKRLSTGGQSKISCDKL